MLFKINLKAFVRLKYGRNEIVVKTDTCSLHIVLYRNTLLAYSDNQEHVKTLRLLYVVCQDDSSFEHSQSANSDESDTDAYNPLARISLNVELLQTFIAECMYKKFKIRKTFVLRTDIREPDATSEQATRPVEIFHSKLQLNDALRMTPRELYLSIAHEVRDRFGEDQSTNYSSSSCKYLAVLSFTRYQPSARKSNANHSDDQSDYAWSEATKGTCALGAEWLAVYGTPCLFSWAERLQDLNRCFTDGREIDTTRLANDSAFRNTYWACYATTLGSMLHELCHIFDLGHNVDGIMARGFDDLHKFFTIQTDKCACYTYFTQVSNEFNIFTNLYLYLLMQQCSNHKSLRQTTSE